MLSRPGRDILFFSASMSILMRISGMLFRDHARARPSCSHLNSNGPYFSSTLSLRWTVLVFQSFFKNEGLSLPVSGLKLTYHKLSEKKHIHEEVAVTYIVLNNVMSRHCGNAELVDLHVDLPPDAAQTGALGEGGVELALRRVSVDNAAMACFEKQGLPQHMPQVADRGSC